MDLKNIPWNIKNISWEIVPSEDITWLTWTLGSKDVEIEGRLPAYSASGTNVYTLHVIAHYLSGDTTLYSKDVNAGSGLAITVDSGDPVVVSPDIVSIDATSGSSFDVTTSYDVTVTFLTSGDTFLAKLNSADVSKINLPRWLTYASTTSGDYVKTLRIFYSADKEPANGTLGSVRIPVTLSDDKTVDIGWNIKYVTSSSSSTAISFDVTGSYDITAVYGETTVVSKDFTYHYQAPVSIVFSPDISADVTIKATSTDAATSDDANAGYITLSVTPLKPLIATYSTDMILTDANSNTAKVTLYINVSMDKMYVSADVASLTVDAGKSADVTFTAYNFNGKVVSWDLGTIPSGITVTTSSDSGDYGETLTLTIVGQASGDYSFDVAAMDSSDRTASMTMYVTVLSPDVPRPGVPGLKVDPVSKSITVQAGGAIVNVDFKALDASGDVAWSVGTLPAGISMVPANESGDTVTYGVRASADAALGQKTVTITASDDAKTATATLYITVSTDAAPAGSLTISPSAPSVTVAVGATQNVSLTASGNSGLVTWTAGTPTGGFSIAPATDTSYATQDMTTMVYTVTGATAGSYSVTVTATDTANHSATATINVTVTGGGTTPTKTDVDIDPSVTITDLLISTLRSALGQLLGFDISGVPVRKLSEGLISGSLTADVSTANSVIFDPIVVSEDGIYIFGVPTTNLTPGYVLHYSAVVTTAADDELIEASAEEEAGVFIDNDGNKIETVPSNGGVNLAAYFEAGKTYNVAVTAVAPSTDPDEYGVGSASGGCSAGLGAIVSALAAAFFISKKRS